MVRESLWISTWSIAISTGAGKLLRGDIIRGGCPLSCWVSVEPIVAIAGKKKAILLLVIVKARQALSVWRLSVESRLASDQK